MRPAARPASSAKKKGRSGVEVPTWTVLLVLLAHAPLYTRHLAHWRVQARRVAAEQEHTAIHPPTALNQGAANDSVATSPGAPGPHAPGGADGRTRAEDGAIAAPAPHESSTALAAEPTRRHTALPDNRDNVVARAKRLFQKTEPSNREWIATGPGADAALEPSANETLLALMLRHPLQHEWGRTRTPAQTKAYLAQCVQWVEFMLQAGAHSLHWVDFLPKTRSLHTDPTEEDMFAPYTEASVLSYERRPMLSHMMTRYKLQEALSHVVAKATPAWIVLCHRPGDVFIVAPEQPLRKNEAPGSAQHAPLQYGPADSPEATGPPGRRLSVPGSLWAHIERLRSLPPRAEPLQAGADAETPCSLARVASPALASAIPSDNCRGGLPLRCAAKQLSQGAAPMALFGATLNCTACPRPAAALPCLLRATYRQPTIMPEDVIVAIRIVGIHALFGTPQEYKPLSPDSGHQASTQATETAQKQHRAVGTWADRQPAAEGRSEASVWPAGVDAELVFVSLMEEAEWEHLMETDGIEGNLTSIGSDGPTGGTEAKRASPCLLQPGPAWEKARTVLSQAAPALKAQADSIQGRVQDVLSAYPRLLLTSAEATLARGVARLQQYKAQVLGTSHERAEQEYLRLCNERAARVDGTLARPLPGSMRRLALELSNAEAGGKGLQSAAPTEGHEERVPHGKLSFLQEEAVQSTADAPGSLEGKGNASAGSFLAAAVYSRIYVEDRFNLSTYELWQWIEYYLYSGVDTIYFYDMARSEGESQERALQQYVESGQLVYLRFHQLHPPNFNIHYEQDSAMRHFLRNFKGLHQWAIAVDVDEYIFIPSDTHLGFLRRLLQAPPSGISINASVSQVLVKNVFFPAPPLPLPKRALLIERYQHRNASAQEGTSRVKALIRLRCVKGIFPGQPHMFPFKCGKTVVLPEASVRMNHYWGLRHSQFEPLAPGEWATYLHDGSIQPIADVIRARLSWLYGMLPAFEVQGAMQDVEDAAKMMGILQARVGMDAEMPELG